MTPQRDRLVEKLQAAITIRERALATATDPAALWMAAPNEATRTGTVADLQQGLEELRAMLAKVAA